MTTVNGAKTGLSWNNLDANGRHLINKANVSTITAVLIGVPVMVFEYLRDVFMAMLSKPIWWLLVWVGDNMADRIGCDFRAPCQLWRGQKDTFDVLMLIRSKF